MKKTISLIGDKEIGVKSFNKNHIRITAMLTILANRESLTTFVVFKGKHKGNKELQQKTSKSSSRFFICLLPG